MIDSISNIKLLIVSAHRFDIIFLASVEAHIEFMLKSFPDWISRIKVKSGTFLKIDRQMELSTLNAKISALAKNKQYALPQT